EGGQESQAEAFAVIERARSRTLLERLQAALTPESGQADPLAARRQALQQELHLLYNQLLGEAGSRRASVIVQEDIRRREAALRQMEWQSPLPLAEAQPVDLATLQAALAPDQQCLAYYAAGDEMLAFVVDRASCAVVR